MSGSLYLAVMVGIIAIITVVSVPSLFTRRCGRCGRRISLDAQVCRHCGAEQVADRES